MSIITAIRRWFAPAVERVARGWTFDPVPLPGSGDKLNDAVYNGEHAARLLQDELLRWSLGEIRQRVRDQMEACPIRDTDGMQVLRLWVEVLKGFEANLQSLIADGRMAGDELARIEREREFETRYGKVPM